MLLQFFSVYEGKRKGGDYRERDENKRMTADFHLFPFLSILGNNGKEWEKAEPILF